MNVKCKICGKSFKNNKGLHMHLSKIHNIYPNEYYVRMYERKDKLTGELLPFHDADSYFNVDFINNENLEKWSITAPEKEVRSYILSRLNYRIESKKLKYAPNHIEIKTYDLPSIDLYKKFFGSYSKACTELGYEPLYKKGISKDFFQDDPALDDLRILIDTREQMPLKFKNSTSMKLDFGDYAVSGEHYDYTYVDRKSESDFKSTMTSGFDRFKREMDRAKSFDSYLYIVIESTMQDVIENNKKNSYAANLPYLWHNVRVMTHEYKGNCQFVFSGGREQSKKIIPKLLTQGKKNWDTDLQYFIDKL